MGEQDPRVHDRGLAEALEVIAERTGAIPLEQLAQHGRGRPLAGTSGPEAALLDERTGPRRGVRFQPGEVRGRHPPADDELRPGIGDDRPDRVDDRADPGPIGRRDQVAPSSAEQDEVERAVDVDPEPGPAAPVVDRHAGVLVQPARQLVVALRGPGRRPAPIAPVRSR